MSMEERILQATLKGKRVRLALSGKKFTQIKRAIGLSEKKIVMCKVCYKKRPIKEMMLMEGGGIQGHRDYWSCNEHI